jgi:hypothetical protein
MAGQEEAMILAARVVDQFSPTLKSLQRSLRSLSAETNAFHKGGIVQSKSHAESLLALRREVGAVGDRVKSGLTPALAGLGISGLSAAAGITAIAASIKEFADTSRHLGILTRQTALTVDQLRVLERLAPRIGTTAEQMDSALAQFNSHMERLQRAPLTELRQTFESLGVAARSETVTAWRNLIGSMQGLPRSEQLAKVIEFLDKVRDIGQKKIVLQAFGLPPELANLTTKELQAAIEEIRSRLKPITADDIVKGRKAADAIDDLKESLQSLRDAIGAGFAEDLSKAAHAMADFVSQHSDEAIASLRDLARGIGLVVTALDELRQSKPVDLTGMINFAGLDKTLEVFVATLESPMGRVQGVDRSRGPGRRGRSGGRASPPSQERLPRAGGARGSR